MLFFFVFLHSCGCETSAEAPGVEERELQETNLYEATGWPNFFTEGAIVQTVTARRRVKFITAAHVFKYRALLLCRMGFHS